ncbi:MAG: Unknown protein, partial [uncultured Aureispira sp.]
FSVNYFCPSTYYFSPIKVSPQKHQILQRLFLILITHVTQDFFYLLLKPIVTYLSYVLMFNFAGLIFNAPCTIKHSTFNIKHSKLRIG